MKFPRTLFFFLCFAAHTSFSQLTEWDVADANVVRFSPDSFPDLPAGIRSWMKTEGYTVPQTYLNVGPHNVISGSFRSKGQTDWAVLASRNRESEILIFWNGSLRKVTSLAKAPDKGYLQEIGSKVIAYSRFISVANRDKVLNAIKKSGREEALIKEYEGIEDQFLDKSSSVHYYSGNSWYNFIAVD